LAIGSSFAGKNYIY